MKFIKNERTKRNKRLRRERLNTAKERGDHSELEWQEMKEFFNHTCCNCFGDSGLKNVEKDHIIPLYQGGSNHIRNLQPLCARCNASKGSDNEDLRPRLANKLGIKLPEEYKNAY